MIQYMCGSEPGGSLGIKVIGMDGRLSDAKPSRIQTPSFVHRSAKLYWGTVDEWALACVKTAVMGRTRKVLMAFVIKPSESVLDRYDLPDHGNFFIVGGFQHGSRRLWDREGAEFWHRFGTPR